MNQEELAKKLLSPSKNSRLEKLGKGLTFACLSLIVIIVAMILIFVAQKGLSTFFVNGVNIFDFLFGQTWNPSGKQFWCPSHDFGFLYCHNPVSPYRNSFCHWSSCLYDRGLTKRC